MSRDLNSFIIAIIKYVDDIDIGHFLLNVHSDMIDREPYDDISAKTNREYFVEHLYCNNKYKKLLMFHLKVLAKSFYSNEICIAEHYEEYEKTLKCDEDSDMLVSPDKTGIICSYKGRDNIISFETLIGCTIIKNADFTQIFRLLMNCYKENKFYYLIDKDRIIKLYNADTNDKPKFKHKVFMLINRYVRSKYVTCVQDTKTGLTYDLDEEFFQDRSHFYIVDDRGVKSSIKLHKHIINALKGIPKCPWCNPYDIKEDIEPCENCKKLIKKLSCFENIDKENPIFNIANIKNEINKIAPNISDNLVVIREKRRQLLKKIVKEIKKELDFGGYKYNKEKLKTQLEKIYELIDKCFDSVV